MLTWVPWLEEDLSPDLVHLACYLSPSFCVAIIVHHRRIGPFDTTRADKGALCDDKSGAVPRSVGVMLDVYLGGFIPIGASIARHGAHANAIAQLDSIPEDNWFKNLCHCIAFNTSQICAGQGNLGNLNDNQRKKPDTQVCLYSHLI